jgi:hypothetical protein
MPNEIRNTYMDKTQIAANKNACQRIALVQVRGFRWEPIGSRKETLATARREWGCRYGDTHDAE